MNFNSHNDTKLIFLILFFYFSGIALAKTIKRIGKLSANTLFFCPPKPHFCAKKAGEMGQKTKKLKKIKNFFKNPLTNCA